MARRLIRSASGFVHDIDQVSSLSDVQGNMRLLSDRSLYLLQNLSGLDVAFLSRYGEILTGGFYLPVESGTSGASVVGDAVDILRRDLNDMSVEETLSCICAQLTNIANTMSSSGTCGCVVGEGADSEEGSEGGSVPRSIGSIDYEEPVAADDRECKAANVIHETIRDTFNELDQYPIADFATFGLVFSISVVTAVMALLLAPAVALIVGVAGAMSIFAGKLIISGVDLGDIVTELDAKEEELVCVLYNATDVGDARDDYLALLTGLSSLELELVELLMTNGMMNLLFFDTAESATFWDGYTGPIDCDSACGDLVMHINLLQAGGEDQGIIIGSNRFLVNDTVSMESITDQDCLPTDRHGIAFEVLDGVSVQQEVEVTTVLTGWSAFSIEPPCQSTSAYWGTGFSPLRAGFTNTEEPEVTNLAGVAVAALRSGGYFTVELTRIS